jgi:hypothetical protein
MSSAAADLAAIGANVNAAHMVAAAPTAAVIPAAADEVSAAIASVFANHAQAFQGLAGKAAAFNDQFVGTLKSGGAAYAQAEATSAASLSSLFSLLPPPLYGILIHPELLGILIPALFLFGPYIGAFFFVAGVELLAYFLMHPQQLLPDLMSLGPTLMALGL